MSKSEKYETIKLIAKPVLQDNNGKYLIEQNSKEVIYRIGKHTKGKLIGVDQLFLTENNLMMVIIETQPLSFKDRHQFNPIARFLQETV